MTLRGDNSLVPSFQAFLLPLLKLSKDGQVHSSSEATEGLAQIFHLSHEARSQLLPSGRQSLFDNRVGWAKTHLSKALLIESAGRGRFRITQRGLDLLAKGPTTINYSMLRQYSEFRAFQEGTPGQRDGDNQEVLVASDVRTPEELMDFTFQSLQRTLAQDLLEQVKRASPGFFEKLVVDLLVKMGYGGSRKDAGQAVGGSGDGGIDGVIKEDKLGLDVVYIQAKRWDGVVGRPTVQGFAGSLDGKRARKGVLITTSQFSKEARDYVEVIEKKIILIDGETLVRLMVEHDVGVTEIASFKLKKIDSEYFEED